MSIGEVQRHLNRRTPVMIMIQAWANADRSTSRWRVNGYSRRWMDGHWVVAIGYDDDRMYFEDPSLEDVRGYLDYRELSARWRDVGPYWIARYERYMYNYGLAIWRAGPRFPGGRAWASHID